MLVRLLVTSLAALAAVIAGCGSSGDGSSTNAGTATIPSRAQAISGPWTGTLTQAGLAPFRIAVLIDPDGTARVAYTGIDCTGTWRPAGNMGFQSQVFDFVERIDRGAGGKCKGTGLVQTVLDSTQRKPLLRYRFRGGGVSSRGTLRRARMSEWVRIFEQAGVQVN